jgi:hypothetical protein
MFQHAEDTTFATSCFDSDARPGTRAKRGAMPGRCGSLVCERSRRKNSNHEGTMGAGTRNEPMLKG